MCFGPHAKFGTIIKDCRNARIVYQPSELVGTKRTGRRGIGKDGEHTICTSHVERSNLTVANASHAAHEIAQIFAQRRSPSCQSTMNRILCGYTAAGSGEYP